MSPEAKAIFDRWADKGWVTWGGLKETLQTPDHVIIAKAWNELRDAGLARGDVARGLMGKVFSQPQE